jgi:2-polyprenyl-3-methyl-5-hydroxy-6-metoxy-1,4-benzoquinol methylase
MNQKRRIGSEYYDQSGYLEAGAATAALELPFQRYRVSKVLEIYMPGRGERVLDLGCAWGTFSFALASRVREVVGVDFSPRFIQYCNERNEALDAANTSFLCADAQDTGLEAGSFDTIIAADFFEHIYPDDSARVVRECFRLLRPEGHFVIWLPNPGHFLEILKVRDILLKHDPSHVDYKSMARMTELIVGAGFDVERAYYVESHVPGLRTLERALLGVVPVLRRRIALLGRKPPRQRVESARAM